MSLYGVVGDGAYSVQQYQRQWYNVAFKNAEPAPAGTGSADLQFRQLQLIQANDNISYANDVVNQICRNIKDLQP